jgi:acyl-CoA thioester hydrolase
VSRFTLSITAQDADIDELGHVNNAVWVQWIQAIATAHWEAVAPAEHKLAYVWVVTRHEIDYRGSVVAGETVVGETWVEGAPKGARFDRHVRFVGDDGRVKLQAVTTWGFFFLLPLGVGGGVWGGRDVRTGVRSLGHALPRPLPQAGGEQI